MAEPWLYIGRVPDDPATLRGSVTDDEWQTALSMGSASRRAEWLAWRAAVRERLGIGTRISYAAEGAPVVDRGFIGVSHTKGWIAVVWSEAPCAVDIEPDGRDTSRTAARFISENERSLGDAADGMFPISVWCAKEAAYKMARTSGLDFLRDIVVTRSDIAAGVMEVSIRGAEPLTVRLLHREGIVAAAIGDFDIPSDGCSTEADESIR